MRVLIENPRKAWVGAAVLQPVLRFGGALVALLAVLTLAGVAAAQDTVHTLSHSGSTLGSIQSAGTLDDLRIVVDVGGDTVVSTHVWAVIGGAEYRQRTNNGYWVPWSGDLTDLVDNRFPVNDGKIVFKIVDGSIAADNQGITFVVGYRAGEVLKFGALGVVPKSGSGS